MWDPNPNNRRAVVVLSGGIDSTVVLAHLLACDYDVVLALSVDYGQSHGVRELEAAQKVARWYKVPWCLQGLDLAVFKEVECSLLNKDVPVPEGHYQHESMSNTVVPNRNMLLLSVAIAAAICRDASVVAYGAHAGDHEIYPDCRPAFVDAMATAARLCWDTEITLHAPFTHWAKAAIVEHGCSMGAPLEMTYSCYNGRERHCGKCGTCVERAEAFRLKGIIDPTDYEETPI